MLVIFIKLIPIKLRISTTTNTIGAQLVLVVVVIYKQVCKGEVY